MAPYCHDTFKSAFYTLLKQEVLIYIKMQKLNFYRWNVFHFDPVYFEFNLFYFYFSFVQEMYFYVLDDKFFTHKSYSYKYENHNSWVIALQDCFMKQFLCDHPSLNRYREEQVIFKHCTKQKILCSNLGFRSTNNINSPRQIVRNYKFHTFGVLNHLQHVPVDCFF